MCSNARVCAGIASFVGDPGLLTERVGEAVAEGMLSATGRVPGQAAPAKAVQLVPPPEWLSGAAGSEV